MLTNVRIFKLSLASKNLLTALAFDGDIFPGHRFALFLFSPLVGN